MHLFTDWTDFRFSLFSFSDTDEDSSKIGNGDDELSCSSIGGGSNLLFNDIRGTFVVDILFVSSGSGGGGSGGDDDLAFKNGFDLAGTGGGTFVAKAERIKKSF